MEFRAKNLGGIKVLAENNIPNEQNAEQQAPAAQAVEVTATTNAPVVETAHDDFDWSVDKRNVSSYSKEEKAKYDQTYESTFKVIEENGLLTGRISKTSDDLGRSGVVSFVATSSRSQLHFQACHLDLL